MCPSTYVDVPFDALFDVFFDISVDVSVTVSANVSADVLSADFSSSCRDNRCSLVSLLNDTGSNCCMYSSRDDNNTSCDGPENGWP